MAQEESHEIEVQSAYTVTFDKKPMGVQIGDEGVIVEVRPGSVAADSGVSKGDAIVSIDGVPHKWNVCSHTQAQS